VNTKKIIRAEILQKLKELDLDLKHQWDQLLSGKVIEIIKSENIQLIHTYLPMDHEINIRPVIDYCWSQNINVLIPKVEGKGRLSHHQIKSFAEVEKNEWGLLEPISGNTSALRPELIITPGLAFNANKYRLGYGGGFYDRFLSKESNSIALCYPFMIREDFEVEDHDLPVNRIISITENRPLVHK